MTVAPYVLAALVGFTLWLAALLSVTVRRRTPLVAFVAGLAMFSVAHVAVLGAVARPRDAPWDALWLPSFFLGHAGICAFAMTFFRSARPRLRSWTILAIVLAGCGLAALGIAAGWRIADAFQPPTDLGRSSLNAYPIVCLAVALSEPLTVLKRSHHGRREASLGVAGILVLVVGGPVYGFELILLGLTSYLGTNLAVPVASVFFAQALWRSNPLPFRVRAPHDAKVPWEVPRGVYLLDEVRPAYAEATFLAVAGKEAALAIVGPGATRQELLGVETVRLPGGERCASIMEATASEFLSRHPRGAVLIDDASYAVAHNGFAAVDAIRFVIQRMPKKASLVVSLARLSREERDAFRKLRGTWVSPPEIHVALAAILRARLGTGDLLGRAALLWGKRQEDLAVADVPSLSAYLRDVLEALRQPSDSAAQPGWSRVMDDVVADLERFWQTPPTDAPAQAWGPAEATFAASGVVRASSVLGVEPSAVESAPSFPLGESIREAFVTSLGPAGDHVFLRVLRALRKEPSALESGDLADVARLADEEIADFGGALDVPEAGRDLVDRARRLRAKLASLSEGR